MKRGIDQNYVTNKRQKTSVISFKNIKNYIKNDCIVELIRRNNISIPKNDNFNEWLCNEGNKHETDIINYIKDNIHDVVYVSNNITDETCTKAEKLISEKVPFLHSVPFCNDERKGIIDLLVRSDYVHLLNSKIPNESSIPYYIVFDIKYAKIQFAADIPYLKNTVDFTCHKCQLYFYNSWVNEFCNTKFSKSYIIGGKNTSKKCLENIGFVDFITKDKHIVNLVNKSIEWVKNLNNNYKNYDLFNPVNHELFPNMCIDSYNYNGIKQEIADNIGEITKIWNVNTLHRKNAFDQNIFSIYDKRLNSSILKIKNNSHANIINNIIKVNRDNDTLLYKNTIPFVEYKDQSNIFLDIETVDGIVFMIGIYVNENDNWNYKVFLTDDKNKLNEELRIITEFYIEYKRLNRPNVLFWHADKNIIAKACERNNIDLFNIKWVNMTSIFIENEIAIKGCFNYGLKQVAKAMKNMNMINIVNDGDCSSGKDAILQAKLLYMEKCDIKKWEQLVNIIEYNKFDCIVLFEIFNFFVTL